MEKLLEITLRYDCCIILCNEITKKPIHRMLYSLNNKTAIQCYTGLIFNYTWFSMCLLFVYTEVCSSTVQ